MYAILLVGYFMKVCTHLKQNRIKQEHKNIKTGKYQLCDYPFGMNLIPISIGWLMSLIYIKIIVTQPVYIPHKNAALTGLAAISATFFSLLAIQHTSFPVVTMMQSSSILPVVFVAIFCTRVTDEKLKLGPKKLITAGLITLGIIIFQFFDQSNQQRQSKDDLEGFFLVILYFVADGFLPDLQAQIKVKYKPQPVEMMAAVNKWGSLYMLIGLIITGHLLGFIDYMIYHPSFSLQLLAMSVFSGIGQFFVYRMIKQFKQHFVPFTISSRKILTVALSIVFYGHSTNILQILGLFLVLGAVTYEFLSQIRKKKLNKPIQSMELNEEIPDQIMQNKSDKKTTQYQSDLQSDRNSAGEVVEVGPQFLQKLVVSQNKASQNNG